MAEANKEVGFEEAFKKLEETVTKLEDENLSLEDALKQYETGVRMADICSKRLSEAQRRVEVLMKTNAGRFKTEAFEADAAAGKKTKKKG